MTDLSSNGGPSRDVGFERRLTAQAAAAAQVGAERLSDVAEGRAGAAPVRDLDSRNFVRDALKDLADSRNYLVWAAQQVADADDGSAIAGEITEALGQSLASTAVAFEHAERARALAVEWRAGRS